ncbi:4194_t:CDS:2 [Funneliformis mosseae]|uniref:4194_t:CDS:1 n=1 Tax=Funneliformis mosseae TaxID=27381 RepID=A0A9N9DNJ2_FUNMO|nr:4194_t:CDS:2 [Funneliformis mosseae]
MSRLNVRFFIFAHYRRLKTDVGPFGIDGLSFTNLDFKDFLDQFALKPKIQNSEKDHEGPTSLEQPYEPIILE